MGAFPIIGHPLAAGARVRSDDHQAEFRRHALEAGFDDEVLLRARQAGKPVERRIRPLPVPFDWRREDREPHLAIVDIRAVGVNPLLAAEAFCA